MQQSILITTLGHSWQLIPELLGFTNPDDFGFYDEHPDEEKINALRRLNTIKPINEVWVISTDNKVALDSIKISRNWLNSGFLDITLRAFILKGVSDLINVEHCRQMSNLIYSVVLAGKKYASNGQLILSLSGGRKTMSADMQEAGNIFGFDAMIHIIDDGKIPTEFRNSNDIDAKYCKHFMPIVAFGKKEASKIVYLEPNILNNKQYEIYIDDTQFLKPDTCLYEEIEERRKKSRNIAFNFYQKIYQSEPSSNFYSLYFLEPDKIEILKSKKIDETNYNLIKKLPKAELHCHLGGIANTKEIIEIAYSNIDKIKTLRSKHEEYDNWLSSIKEYIVSGELSPLEDLVKNSKQKLFKYFNDIPEPYNLAGFLVQFRGYEDILDKLIYGKYLQSEKFTNIGIEEYSSLGDLQGSGLLQTKESLIAACNILKRKAKEHNVKYLELRCSPNNYTKCDLSVSDVVNTLIENLKSEDTIFKLIFIATRHKKMSEIYQIIEFVLEHIDNKNNDFAEMFVGFDLAGNEELRKPVELRNAFLPILEKCLKITIHAGETAEAESIWEAIYHLSADRIGHGLKLLEKKDLIGKIKERKISIELCPSSNKQILDFTIKEYPIKKYLNEGLRVTINTDNIGISRTDFTNEYIVASNLINNNLNFWEVLQLIKNSFISAFCKADVRKDLVLQAEREVLEIINEEFFK